MVERFIPYDNRNVIDSQCKRRSSILVPAPSHKKSARGANPGWRAAREGQSMRVLLLLPFAATSFRRAQTFQRHRVKVLQPRFGIANRTAVFHSGSAGR